MKFDHTVKLNGKIYPTGAEVPVGTKQNKGATGSNNAGQSGEGNTEYKKSDISKMNIDDLKKLAAELSIAVTDESTGKVLKGQIIEKLGL